MITVGKAAKMFRLSRTALLYYDSIGLLEARRADNGYRVYSDEDIERLGRIISLRSAGLPLGEISLCLESGVSDISSVLFKRLGDINREIEGNRARQGVIIKLLQNTDVKQKRQLNPEEWIETLRKAGVDKDNALEWHTSFEKQSPERHRELLKAIGFSEEEVTKFKNICRTSGSPYGL